MLDTQSCRQWWLSSTAVRSISHGVLVGMTVVFFSSCSSGKRNLVVYSPHGKEMLSAFEKAFEAVHPEIDVQWLDMGSQDVYDRIRTERQNPQADIWWGAPMTIFEKAAAEGLLEPYVPGWKEAVSDRQRSGSDFWYGTFVTPEVIMYNNRLLTKEQAPSDWDDLLDPKWQNKVIIRYPLASGTMRTVFSAIIQREERRVGTADAGFAWLRKLDANTKTYAADPTQLYVKIAREEGLISLWDLPDVILQVKINNYPFGYAIPASGTPLLTDGIAIVKGTRKRKEAEWFYEFVTSKESMIEQAQKFYRIPTRNDIPKDRLPDWLTSLEIKPMDIDWRGIEAHEKEWMKIWDERIKGSGKKYSSQ